MTTLHIFPPAFGEPSISPFCVKTVAQLTMAGLDWQPLVHRGRPEVPYGRLPYLETDGHGIADSSLIQEWVGARFDLWPGCDTAGQAVGHAMIRMVEENLCLGLVHDRWLDEACWPIMRAQVFAGAPQEVINERGPAAQSHMRGVLETKGIATLSAEDRLRRLTPDLDALNAMLGKKNWLLGDQPTAADAAIVPVIRGIAAMPAPTSLYHELQKRPKLIAWAHRFADLYYPTM